MLHKGKSGKEYANPQVMRHKEGAMEKSKGKEHESGGGAEPKADGETNDIPSALAEAHGKMGGKHMHIHESDDGKITSHQHSDMGPEGPHEHPDKEALKAHMDDFMGDGDGDGMPMGMGHPMGGMMGGGGGY